LIDDVYTYVVDNHGAQRKDIATLFPKYPNAAASGFSFTLGPEDLLEPAKLIVRVYDDDQHYTDILHDRDVHAKGNRAQGNHLAGPAEGREIGTGITPKSND
jgi:hypothetical protein